MSIFEQPSNTKTGGMMRKINLTLTGVLAVLAFVFTLGAGPIHAQMPGYNLPFCPIKQFTVPLTTTKIKLPDENPLGETLSISGSVQFQDQTGATASLTSYQVVAGENRITYARTVNALTHATGKLTFNHGCNANTTDVNGSNACAWEWGDTITESYQGALQEDVTSGKLTVDLTLNNTTPIKFSCPICGADRNFTIPPSNQIRTSKECRTRSRSHGP